MADTPHPASTPSADRIWDYKPWWCQPWSILLTGNGLIVASWVVGQRYWLTGLVAVPLIAWMGFFVGIFPRMARESGMLAAMKQEKMAASDRDPTD